MGHQDVVTQLRENECVRDKVDHKKTSNEELRCDPL